MVGMSPPQNGHLRLVEVMGSGHYSCCGLAVEPSAAAQYKQERERLGGACFLGSHGPARCCWCGDAGTAGAICVGCRHEHTYRRGGGLLFFFFFCFTPYMYVIVFICWPWP